MESADAGAVGKARETEARSRASLAVFSVFVGLILGLLTPVYMFGQRLAVQEERMSVMARGVEDISRKLDAVNSGMSDVRESLAQKGIRIRKGE